MLTSAIKLLKNTGLFLGSFYIIAAALLYFLQGYLLFPAPGDPQAQLPSGAEYVDATMPDGVRLKHIRLRNVPDAPMKLFAEKASHSNFLRQGPPTANNIVQRCELFWFF